MIVDPTVTAAVALALEANMLCYTDYMRIPISDNGERLVPVPSHANLCAIQGQKTMKAFTGDKVYVREAVAVRLQVAAELLCEFDHQLRLEVRSGYRALTLQVERFQQEYDRLLSLYPDDEDELLSAVHRIIAVPSVAGHPAGAAVDVDITRDGEPIDMGGAMSDCTPHSYSHWPFLTREARFNRDLQRRIMMGAGFAPFDGERWHYSFGDVEWACYYGKRHAIYGQVEFRAPGLS